MLTTFTSPWSEMTIGPHASNATSGGETAWAHVLPSLASHSCVSNKTQVCIGYDWCDTYCTESACAHFPPRFGRAWVCARLCQTWVDICKTLDWDRK